jgi:hypothetical protein
MLPITFKRKIGRHIDCELAKGVKARNGFRALYYDFDP